MKQRITAAFAAICALVFMLTGCGGAVETDGNTADVELNGGDVFAVISVMDYGDITCKLFPKIAPVAVEKFTALAKRGYYDGKDFHRIVEDFIVQGGSFNGDGTDGEIAETDYFPIETSDYARHFYGALGFAASEGGNYAQFYIVNNNVPQDIDAVIAKLTEQLADTELTARLTAEQLKYYKDYCASLEKIPENVRSKYATVGGDYSLDGTSTVFGQVIDGFEVLEAISASEVVTGNKIDDLNGISSKPINVVVIEKVEIVNIDGGETTTTKAKPVTTTPTTTTTDQVNAITANTDILTSTTEAALQTPTDAVTPSGETTTALPENTTTALETATETSSAPTATEPEIQTAADDGTVIDVGDETDGNTATEAMTDEN